MTSEPSLREGGGERERGKEGGGGRKGGREGGKGGSEVRGSFTGLMLLISSLQ